MNLAHNSGEPYLVRAFLLHGGRAEKDLELKLAASNPFIIGFNPFRGVERL
jgi:hypothetical protein